MQVFVIINSVEIKIIVDVNVKNPLTKEYVIKKLIVNVINYVTQENSQIVEKKCKHRKKLVNKIVEECSGNIDGNEIIYRENLNGYRKVCNFCAIYIGVFIIFFKIRVSISSSFIFFYWYLKKDNASTNANIKTGTLIYQTYKYKWEILNRLILKIVQITF